MSKDEAIDIAKGEISFAPDGVVVRNVPRSLDQRRVWAVSLFTGTATRPQLCQVVEVDADSGDVDAVHQC